MTTTRAQRPHQSYLAPIPAPAARLQWTRTDSIILAVLTVAALITRFVGLGRATGSGTPVFDEKHYVPQAFDMVASTNSIFLGGIESNPAYGLVVHPPLAKQLIALGEHIFGYTPLGWRVVAALFGTLAVIGITLLARELSCSRLVGTLAGILATIDGVLIVASRFGMLDIFLTVFIIAATYCLARDHHDTHTRFHHAYTHNQLYSNHFGPYMGFRWWRFAAGISLGLALSVKWSGLYYMAFFGIYLVIHDALLRRRYLITRPTTGMLLRDATPNFLAMVIAPIAMYLYSWRAWFAEETSVYRHAGEQGLYDDTAAYYDLPKPIANFLYYHHSVLKFHSTLTTSSGHQHPWESKPWTWLWSGRPILYLSDRDITCLGDHTCDRLIYMFGVPAVWWLTIPILLVALYLAIRHRDYSYTLPLVAFAAGFIPWVIGYDRQMYFFYATTLIPFTITLLALHLGKLANLPTTAAAAAAAATTNTPDDDTTSQPNKRTRALNPTFGPTAVRIYMAVAVTMFVYFIPIIYGIALPKPWFDALLWLPNWR